MTKANFRILLTISFFLGYFGAFYDFIFTNELLEKINTYSEQITPVWSDEKSLLIGGFYIILILVDFGVFVGLFFFYNFARLLYIPILVVGYIASLFLGVLSVTSISWVLCSIATLLAGIVLYALFTEPVKSYFTNRAEGSSLD
jgi:hypothetical protein